MILSHADLKKAVKSNEIGFSPPLENNQRGEASVNLRLSFEFIKLRKLDGVTLSVASGLGAVGQMNIWHRMVLKEKDEHGHPQ